MPKKTLIERFWAKVAVIDDEDSCWLWTGALDHGYGVLKVASYVTERAHRVSYMIEHGSIPDDRPFITHTCDHPACVRPKHLKAATAQNNTDDMMNRGRFSGSGHRLSKEAADEVKMLYRTGKFTHRDLAAHFGVGTSTIKRILDGTRWDDRQED